MAIPFLFVLRSSLMSVMVLGWHVVQKKGVLGGSSWAPENRASGPRSDQVDELMMAQSPFGSSFEVRKLTGVWYSKMVSGLEWKQLGTNTESRREGDVIFFYIFCWCIYIQLRLQSQFESS